MRKSKEFKVSSEKEKSSVPHEKQGIHVRSEGTRSVVSSHSHHSPQKEYKTGYKRTMVSNQVLCDENECLSSISYETVFDSGYSSTSFQSSSSILQGDNAFFDSGMSIGTSELGIHFPEHEYFIDSDFKKESETKCGDVDVCTKFDSGLGIELGSDVDNALYSKEKTTLTPHLSETVVEDFQWQSAFHQDQDGDTLLHLAIVQETVEISLALVRFAMHPDMLDIFNHLSQTPLHLAVLTGQYRIVRRLIVAGATVDMRDRHGNTAFHIACERGDMECLRALTTPVTENEVIEANLQYPVDLQYLSPDFLEHRNYEGQTCLHLAVQQGHMDVIRYLVQCDADVNGKEGKSGRTSLHLAVEAQRDDLVQFLLNTCHADVNIQNYAGHSPLHVAWSVYQLEPTCSKLKNIVIILKNHGGEPRRPPESDVDSDSDSSGDEVRAV
uniref:IkB n=1 Tax=Carcinoscorpius rotundicauda TaxID=6848 RepID=Q20KN0_CARRO|nr:IkB [Carcinoscorpius rotundicauda]